MKRIIPIISIGLVLWHCQPASAADTISYGLIEESSFFILSLGCVAAAGFIYQTLKGGSLGTPWLFFIGGFTLAGSYAAIQLLDILKIAIYQYDCRLAELALRISSMLLLMIGLIL
jgi:hypothetical protein